MRSSCIPHSDTLAEKPSKRLEKPAKPSLVFFDGISKGPDGADPEQGPNNHVSWTKTPETFGKSGHSTSIQSIVTLLKL
jgi:hypothetical protein